MYRPIRSYITLIVLLLMSGCSSGFYVKVIDQYGEPVPDVLLRISWLTNAFLVSGGSGSHEFITDDEGRFSLGGPRVHTGLIEKNGYEFSSRHGFGSYLITPKILKEFYAGKPNSYKNPYYILAWQREAPEQLLKIVGGVGLKPNDIFYQLKLVSNRPFWNKFILRDLEPGLSIEQSKAPLLVRYKEVGDIWLDSVGKERRDWEITIKAPQGGLITTKDLIRNLAPEDGYQPEITFRSSDFRHNIPSVKRSFYFKAQDGQVYGQFKMTLDPSRRYVGFDTFWLNPNGSRNLTRPKKYAYCVGSYSPRDCSLDDYGP